MIKLKDLLGFNNKIIIMVENEDFKDFLEFAKEEGCIWNGGNIIKPNLDKQGKYKSIVVSNDYFISYPGNVISRMALSGKPIYSFSDIKNNIQKYTYHEKSARTVKKDEDFDKSLKMQEIAYENKCKKNRELSKLQLKYKSITSKLQKCFFARYENDDELFKLFELLNKYGYENYYSITIDNFRKDPKIIYIDNENMRYLPADIILCESALMSDKKIYDFNDFQRIMLDTFSKGDISDEKTC